MRTTTLVMKNLLHYTIAIVQKLQISAVFDLGRKHEFSWLQVRISAKLKRQTFLASQMPSKFLQCFIANREAFVMVWKDLVCLQVVHHVDQKTLLFVLPIKK